MATTDGDPKLIQQSIGAAIAGRAALEAKYARALEREMQWFVERLASAARVATGPLPTSAGFALWEEMIERLRAAGVAESLLVILADSSMPGIATGAAQIAYNTALVNQLAPSALGQFIEESLGLRGDEPGKLITGPGLSRNWLADARGLANTAATSDFNAEVLAELAAEGYPYKRWSNRADNRVRPAHIVADNQTVPLEQDFIVDGERLAHPADPNGSWDNIMNCRCVVVGVRFGDRAMDYPAGLEPWNMPYPGKPVDL
nr:MAG TPA: minor capsid component [Caudoviricetes sp.]